MAKTGPQASEAIKLHLSMLQAAELRRTGLFRVPDDWRYAGAADFILREGQDFTPAPLPANVRRGRMRECFKNAFELMMVRSDLVYVEGYAVSILPVMHAWCVDLDGNVVDPTWEDGSGKAYFGVPFDRDFAIDTVLNKGYYGLIDDTHSNYKLLRGCDNWRHPAFSPDDASPPTPFG